MTPRHTMRCSICAINWPYDARFKRCPQCGDEIKGCTLPDNEDHILTIAEADSLLVELGLKPAPGVMAPQGPRPQRLSKYTFKREKDKLLEDLERWASEVPPWMHR